MSGPLESYQGMELVGSGPFCENANERVLLAFIELAILKKKFQHVT